MPRFRHPITAGSLVAVTSGRWVPPRWPCHVTGGRRHDPYGSSHDESAHHEHAVGTTGRHHASAAGPLMVAADTEWLSRWQNDRDRTATQLAMWPGPKQLRLPEQRLQLSLDAD